MWIRIGMWFSDFQRTITDVFFDLNNGITFLQHYYKLDPFQEKFTKY
jgi:hypothetical protein